MKRIFILMGSPIWLPVLLAFYAVVFSICLSLWAVLVALAFAFVAGIPHGVILGVSGNIPACGFYIGSALVCLGVAILFFYICRAATKLGIFTVKSSGDGIIESFT